MQKMDEVLKRLEENRSKVMLKGVGFGTPNMEDVRRKGLFLMLKTKEQCAWKKFLKFGVVMDCCVL